MILIEKAINARMENRGITTSTRTIITTVIG